MNSLLHYTKNTRAILPDSLRFIRSDLPARLDDEDIRFLLDNAVTTAVDLRSYEEVSKKPCPLASMPEFSYLNLPVNGGGAVPASPDEVVGSYIAMLDGIESILDAIKSGRNVLYFCNAGKDRTGVVSALLLCELGFDREYIVRDYLESGENLRGMLEEYSAAFGVDKRIITPRREYIEGLLDYIRISWINRVFAEKAFP